MLGRTHSRVRYLITETSGKCFVPGVIEMLIAKEKYFVFQQCFINKLECLRTDIAAQFYAVQLRTNSTCDGFYLNCHSTTPAL